MESVFDIIKCMETGIFKQATTNARIEMLKQQYEKDIEKAFRPKWEENWNNSLPFVSELVNMDFQLTKLLHTATTWGDTPHNEQYLNLEPIKHNQEFVKQILALQNIWRSMDMLLHRKVEKVHRESIDKSVRLFYEKNPQYGSGYDYSIIEEGEIRFFDIVPLTLETSNGGGCNMYTGTTVLETLIY